MRVVQARRDLDLVQEALGADRCRQIGLEDFERYLPVVLDVFREIDRGHAAGPDLADDRVAVRQRGGESLNKVGHNHARSEGGAPCTREGTVTVGRRRETRPSD